MLGSSSTAAATLSTSTSPATSPSPSRPGRLRGLSYLRNYTHLHHSSAASRSTNAPAPLTRSRTEPGSPDPTRSPTVQADPQLGAPSPRRSSASTGNPTSGWVPTVGGQSGISPVAPAPQATATDSSGGESGTIMTRNRSETVVERGSSSMVDDYVRRPSAVRSRSVDPAEALAEGNNDKKSQLPTIRMIPHHDARSSRPSLSFPIINRTLPTTDAILRVGRYSERDNQAASLENDTVPVGFKSKVVSRRHCEFWCSNGQWFVKDVKSSSGTFLNHVRLSSAGTESKPYPVNDGDIVQLGIDFKGGEEVIFRCVKIRIECNRSWQKALNNFNTSTHKRLRNLTTASRQKDPDGASASTQECSICLNPVAPCQALFVAPCSHVWHYKCIRTLIYKEYPSFQCPNCRAYADLEADVEDTEGSESEAELDEVVQSTEDSASVSDGPSTTNGRPPAQLQQSSTHQTLLDHSTSDGDGDDELSSAIASTTIHNTNHSRSRSHSGNNVSSEPVAIPPTSTPMPPSRLGSNNPFAPRSATPTSTTPFALAPEMLTPGGTAIDGLSTPRNELGPFILDSGIDDVVASPSRSGRRGASQWRTGRPTQ